MTCQILVVDDQFLLAESLSDQLRAEGYAVIGPFSRVGPALRAAESEPIDAAILDIDIDGESVCPLADRLAARDVPFAFFSAHAGAGDLPRRHRAVPRFRKPCDFLQIGRAMATLIGRQQSAADLAAKE